MAPDYRVQIVPEAELSGGSTVTALPTQAEKARATGEMARQARSHLVKATFLIAASLIVSTAAIAQTTNPDPSASTTTDNMAPQTTPAPTDSTMPAPAPDAGMPAPAPMPDNSMPAANGGMAPSGGMNAMPAPTTADMSSYPACSRSVQDHCVQKHEMARKRR